MYITRPDPILVDGQSQPIDWFIAAIVNSEGRFNKTGPGIRAGMRILMACASATGDEPIDLTRDDHALLHAACEEPECGYPVRPARAVLAFLDAIAGATEEKPARASEPGAPK